MTLPTTPLRSRVRAYRERAGLRPVDLARRVGVTRQALHSIETGAYVPNTVIALHLARALGCTVHDLFSLGEPEVEATLIGADLHDRADAQFNRPTRVRLAQVRGRWLAFPALGQGGLTEAADGLVKAADGHPTTVELFGDLELAQRTAVLAGCDPSLALLPTHVARQHSSQSSGCRLLLHALSSKAALRALEAGEAHAAGIHLYDAATGESNLPFVKQHFPQSDMLIYTLWSWEQGLQVAPGNPQGITGVGDLRRGDLRLQNREPDAGSRLLLDSWLDRAGFSVQARLDLPGYLDEAPTPLLAAERVASGQADVAPGPRSAAVALGLDFIPLQTERFDLVVPAEHAAHPGVRAMLNVVQEPTFRAELRTLGGYDPAHAGELWHTRQGATS